MGAPKTSVVGGGSATPTANAYNGYLQGQLGTTSNFNNATNSLLGGNNGTGTVMNPSMNMMTINPSTYGVTPISMINPDVNSARANAIAGIVNTQNKLNLANTNARYSSGGMSALGSGASMAAAQQNTIGQNQLLSGLQGVTQQDITNNLQYGQVNNANALQAQGMQGQDTLSRLGLQNSNNLGTAQLQQSGMMGILQQIFGGLNSAQAKGTPQAQVVQTPSTMQTIMSGLQGLMGLFGGMGGLSGMSGGGGGGGGSSIFGNTTSTDGVNWAQPGSDGTFGDMSGTTGMGVGSNYPQDPYVDPNAFQLPPSNQN